MANRSYFFKGYCEGWACRGHVVEDGEETHIIKKPSGDELQLCSSCLADYRQDYPAPNNACSGQKPMEILKAYKVELDPNNIQRTALLKHVGAARFVWNWALARRKAEYESIGKSSNAIEQHRQLNLLKKYVDIIISLVYYIGINN